MVGWHSFTQGWHCCCGMLRMNQNMAHQQQLRVPALSFYIRFTFFAHLQFITDIYTAGGFLDLRPNIQADPELEW